MLGPAGTWRKLEKRLCSSHPRRILINMGSSRDRKSICGGVIMKRYVVPVVLAVATLAACAPAIDQGTCEEGFPECLETLYEAYSDHVWLGIELDESGPPARW